LYQNATHQKNGQILPLSFIRHPRIDDLLQIGNLLTLLRSADCNFEISNTTAMKKPALLIDVKLITIAFLVLVVMFSSKQCDAQSTPRVKVTHCYRGLQASYGRNSFRLQSNFPKIDNVFNLDGGQLGVVFGNNVVRFDLGLIGYYSSVGNITGTIDLYTNHAMVRFFPLGTFTNRTFRIDPYVSLGTSYNRSKCFGYYASADDATRNYSVVREDYVGSIRQLNGTAGVGFEFKLHETYDFVHLFSEVQFNQALQSTTTRDVLSKTSLTNSMAINVGIIFGRRKPN
jgi:hypothetical protein